MFRSLETSVISVLFLFMILLKGYAGTDKEEAEKGKLHSEFTESLARYVNGTLTEQNQHIEDGRAVNSSVILIPTYYGYHSFLGVLDNYILTQTDITSLRTWRLAERNMYVIFLSANEKSVRILYDSINSRLLLTAPSGY